MQQFQGLLSDFYKRATHRHSHSEWLNLTAQRVLVYHNKDIERKGKEKDGSGSDKPLSQKSVGSDRNSSEAFQCLKRVYSSSRIEALLLFYGFYRMLVELKGEPIPGLLDLIKSRMNKPRLMKGVASRQRFQGKLSQLRMRLKWLQRRAAEGKGVEWLWLQAFKDFEEQSVVAAQLLSGSEILPSREDMRQQGYSTLLRELGCRCSLFDHTSKGIQEMGEGPLSLQLAVRAEHYFLLDAQQLHKYRRAHAKEGQRSEITQKTHSDRTVTTSALLGEFSRLKLTYKSNSLRIGEAFDYRDARGGQRGQGHA